MERPLLTKHAQLLLCVANDCNLRMREIADEVGVSERAAYGMLCDLVELGYLSRERDGRRNCYRLHPSRVPDAADQRDALLRLAGLLEQADPL